jgi:membrane-bound metal-dependent hydrolase YbcI (DUF457 family)
MPTPIGHGLAGIAAGWTIARPAKWGRPLVVQAVALAALAAAPDLDLLVGRHSAQSHSLGAAAIAATIAAVTCWPIAEGRSRIWWAAFAAWASHPLLDALALDTSPPIGVMAFWPLSSAYVQTGWSIFAPISRAYGAPGFVAHTMRAVAREVAITGPLVYAAWRLRARPRMGTRRPDGRADRYGQAGSEK